MEDQGEWDAFLGASPLANILQSYQWGEFKAAFGWQPRRVLVEEGGRPVAGAQMLLRRLPLGTVAYVPRGPLFDFDDERVSSHLLGALHEQAREGGAFFLKIEPGLPDSARLAARLSQKGFRPGEAVQPRSTLVVDLTAEPDVMLARLSARTRYNVRLAERKGLRCLPGGASELAEFYRLLEETAKRGHFFIHPPEYYHQLWARFAPSGNAHLMLVRYEREVLAALMFFTCGRKAYQLYSGSSTAHRRLKPNELLEWGAMLRARELGCTSYDLWGVPDEPERAEKPDDEAARRKKAQGSTMHGVYQFKRGFGGSLSRVIGAYDYAYNPARYWLWSRAMPLLRQAVAATLDRHRQRGTDKGALRLEPGAHEA